MLCDCFLLRDVIVIGVGVSLYNALKIGLELRTDQCAVLIAVYCSGISVCFIDRIENLRSL